MTQTGQPEISLASWDPQRVLRKLDPTEARYSRGFLRCRPEKWFPGVATQWLPLAHSLGVEVKVTEVKTVLVAPRTLRYGFAGTVDDEPVAMLMDEASYEALIEAITPGTVAQAAPIVVEYMARRFLSSLALAWSGPEASVVRFDPQINPLETPAAGAVKFAFEINGSAAVVWVVIGKLLLERLDGLWRRQVRSSAKGGAAAVDLRLEIAQLAVPVSMLSDYTRSGSVIDLEVVATDLVTLRHSGKGWLPGRLCSIGGNLGFEVISGPVASPILPEGTTRLSIEVGAVKFDAVVLSEMAQVGAIWDTGIRFSDKVALAINAEKVADAALCLFEGRFAISVE